MDRSFCKTATRREHELAAGRFVTILERPILEWLDVTKTTPLEVEALIIQPPKLSKKGRVRVSMTSTSVLA